ncbi:MAG: hypothetical protein JWQ48_2380 [Conexibacter sp.]|nr:hypothetical protein [Conexibacter sp.]
MTALATAPTGAAHGDTPRIALELLDVRKNVRDLDPAHVSALAESIRLRGILVPVVIRYNEDGVRARLIAGEHRYAAAGLAGEREIPYTLAYDERASADQAAENILRKQLSPLGEARAVAAMLEEGYTYHGIAAAVGWAQRRVTDRAKILKLPAPAQELLDNGTLPVSVVDALLTMADAGAEPLRDALLAAIASGDLTASRFANEPGSALWNVITRDSSTMFLGAWLDNIDGNAIAALKLGKKTTAAYEQATAISAEFDRWAYGLTIRFDTAEIDQARAAGVLLEIGHGKPIITDRSLYRELVRQAIARTLAELQARRAARASGRASSRTASERTPVQEAEAEHRAQTRELTRQAHGVNLDLGAALMQNLGVVDPDDMNVARFFVRGLLGPESSYYLGTNDHAARVIAENGIRLVVEQFRETTTPTLRSGRPGRTRVAYGDVADASKWLWTYIDGAKTAGELYGRGLVAFAAQTYALQLVLATSRRRGPVLPRSHNDAARRAFEKIAGAALPASYKHLQKGIAREARAHDKRIALAMAAAQNDTEPAVAPEDLEDALEADA